MDNYFYINKKKIYYQKFGNGEPLIMLHGISSSSNTWKQIVKTMEKYRTIIALDLRGHGKSDHFSTYKWVDYSEDIVSIISRDIQEPVEILGHSLGACIASQIAAIEPNLIRSLILEDPPFYHPKRVGREKILERFKTQLELSKNTNKNEIFLALIKDNNEDDKKKYKDISENLFNLDSRVLEETINGSALIGFDPDLILRKINKIKVLLIVADEQKSGGVLIKKEVKKIQKILNNLTVSFFSNTGHNIHVEKEDLFIQQMTDFLNIK